MKNNYRSIDKTAALRKALEEFPSVYIEGAAACGKHTAVQMLMEQSAYRITLYEVDRQTSKEMIGQIAEQIRKTAGENRVIVISRESPPVLFLQLVWKRQMELLSQKEFRLNIREISQMIEAAGSPLDAEEVLENTEGWAGCVDLLVRLSVKQEMPPSVEKLLRSYEIRTYLREEILESLQKEEQKLVMWAGLCPWINEALCDEIGMVDNSKELLEDLGRKGIFRYDEDRKYWKLSRLFETAVPEPEESAEAEEFLQNAAQWYEKRGYVRNALTCFQKIQAESSYRTCMKNHFEVIPFLEISYTEVLSEKEDAPWLCYLRGMHYYKQKKLKGLNREIEKLEEMDAEKKEEILLNLYFAKPDYSLDDWLNFLEKTYKENGQKKLQLYHVIGSSWSFLNGIRDLTALFACERKEENRKARIWKTCLGEWEWKCYCLARLDYYLETLQKDLLHPEDLEILLGKEESGNVALKEKQLEQMRLYVLGKLLRIRPNEEYERLFRITREKLRVIGTPRDIRNAEAIMQMTALGLGRPQELTHWLRHMESRSVKSIEETEIELWCQAKGYLLLNQYEKAEKILRRVILEHRIYGRRRILAEAWFMQAIVSRAANRQGQMLQNAIESFLISGEYRYVDFYTLYGKDGGAVLEAYIDWHRQSFPEGWSRKKKYQYGNILRMPMEDYLSVVEKNVRKAVRNEPVRRNPGAGERLTMMELLILQHIGHGLSNAEICQELNLKLPTVKSHIYSMYKKLGVNSRVQAVNKGKEMEILR